MPYCDCWQYCGEAFSLRPKKNGFAARPNEVFLLQIIFLLGAIVGPILVLTADIAKSSIVGGIVGVPIAILIVGTCRCHPTQGYRGRFAQESEAACW